MSWIPSREMAFSDHLSRNVDTSQKQIEPTCKGLDLKIQDIYLNSSNDKCLTLATETDEDEILVTLKNQIIKVWPGQRRECPRNFLEYWNYHDELSILDGLA